jgi:hypothetical protein
VGGWVGGWVGSAGLFETFNWGGFKPNCL